MNWYRGYRGTSYESVFLLSASEVALGIVSIVLGIIIIKKTEYIIEILSTAIGIFMLLTRFVQTSVRCGISA